MQALSPRRPSRVITETSPGEAVCPLDDNRGRAIPLDKESWSESFPVLADVISRVDDQGRWDDFDTVRATRWSAGRVAIIGDASHGQPPWLGQAANLAFANALALAEFVTYSADVPTGPLAWENTCRPITDHTERWSNAYGRVVGIWPPSMQSVRSFSLRAFTHIPGIERMLNRAQHRRVIGTERLPLRQPNGGCCATPRRTCTMRAPATIASPRARRRHDTTHTGRSPRVGPTSEEPAELVAFEAGVAEDARKRSSFWLAMERNDDEHGSIGMAETDVAPSLPHDLPANLFERAAPETTGSRSVTQEEEAFA